MICDELQRSNFLLLLVNLPINYRSLVLTCDHRILLLIDLNDRDSRFMFFDRLQERSLQTDRPIIVPTMQNCPLHALNFLLVHKNT